MRTRQRRLQASAWRVPSLYAAGALGAGIALPRLENHFLPDFVSPISVSGALGMYSSIASGMIALTGIVFSLTFLMVQFSATAYSPRLVLWLARDPFISHALGVFMATFLYALVALSWVDRGRPGVPFASVAMAFVLLLASVGVFIGLIQRIAVLQINRLLAFTGDRGRAVIDSLYPALDSPDGAPQPRGAAASAPARVVTHRGRPLVVQAIHSERLVDLAERFGLRIEIVTAVGDTLFDTMPLLHVHGDHPEIDERLLTEAIEVGDERTFDQDPKYAIRILVDIAVKALSPAINDPTTAVQALDQIGDLLLRLARRRVEIGTFYDSTGEWRLFVAYPSWEDFLRLGLDEILSYGATSVQVMRRMNALISDLLTAVPLERRRALRQWKDRLQSSIDRHFAEPDEKREASSEDRQGLGISRPPHAA